MTRLFTPAALAIAVITQGQNLVPNGSFELYSDCPTGDDQVELATGWAAFLYSPDFWHVCGVPGISGVPDNGLGHQEAHSGAGYAGVHAFTGQGQSADGYREYMGAQLLDTLLPGTTYRVQFFVSCTLGGSLGTAQYANNNLGSFFATLPRQGFLEWYPLPNYAHVYGDEIVTDTTNWVLVDGTFVADSAYTYVYVGNFFGDLETDDSLINPSGQFGLSYYYVDDICVTPLGGDCGFVGVPTVSDEPSMWIGPSPFNDLVRISMPLARLVDVRIYSAIGELVHAEPLFTTPEGTNLRMPELASGVYLFQIVTDHQELRQALLIHD